MDTSVVIVSESCLRPAGFDLHPANGIRDQAGYDLEPEPQDPVGDLSEPVFMADDDDRAANMARGTGVLAAWFQSRAPGSRVCRSRSQGMSPPARTMSTCRVERPCRAT